MLKRWAVIVAAALLIAGCGMKQPVMSPQKKAFEEEDTITLYALDAEARGYNAAAAQYYALLYERAPRPAYRTRFFENLLSAGHYKDVITNVDAMEAKSGYDVELERYRVRALIGKNEIEAAKSRALELVAKTRAKQDYVITADIYTMQRHYDTALKYLESAYAIDFDEAVLDKLAVMMYVNLDRKKDAIAQLETHTRLYGCSPQTCKRLAGFYSDQNDIEGMRTTYLRLYDTHPDPQVAEAIIRIYSYEKDALRLQLFLEKSHADDRLLLQIYINNKDYENAARLSEKLYEQSGDRKYLGQNAIFEFEAAENKKDPELIRRVTAKLETVVTGIKDPLLLNYLGYLLIDNEIDIKRGMAFVEAALELEPDSGFYLDSLAWGYYKLGNCKKADELMQAAVTAMGTDKDEELTRHIKAINKCLKGEQ